jgi:CheY-like chemotaxis protein
MDSGEIRILIAEDNEFNQLVITEFLKNTGWITEIVASGREVINKVAEKHYDLILMDIQMPDMDGVETTQMLRMMPGEYTRNIPIIAVSANASKEQNIKYLSLGMNGYITKPFSSAKLIDKIKEFLQDKNHGSN